MRLIVPNLTFEDDLVGRRANVSVHAQRAFRELAPLMGHVADDGDVVVVPDIPKPQDLPLSLQHVAFRQLSKWKHHHAVAATSIVPWGWTQPLRTLATDAGYNLEYVPSPAAVYEVNSRRFNAGHDVLSMATDTEGGFEGGFEGGTFGLLCDSIDAWQDGVRQLQSSGYNRWVTKAQISHAGRNRLLGSGIELNDQQRGWLAKQLAMPSSSSQGDGVSLEPWVPVIDECGLQFEIAPFAAQPPDQPTVEFIGITQLINDNVGRYRGSLIAADDRLQQSWQTAIQHGFAVCQAARAVGYWGPLGIDAFRFMLPTGDIALRLCNDINARFTMGRVALHLRKWLQSNEYGLWTHHVRPTDPMEFATLSKTLSKLPAAGVRTVATSPQQIAGETVRQQTSLLISHSSEQLLHVAQKLQNPIG